MLDNLEREYKLSINPRILELLGPSLYTNIYYILAELIANAYDADAENVYIISTNESITVEDDGKGMSYANGDIKKYLDVASVSRQSDDDARTAKGRHKMGRKGVGKLAALSVSENVHVKTIFNGEKSGFILSRQIAEDNLLTPLAENQIKFTRVTDRGTAVVMLNPQYKLHKDLHAIKRNLLKIFPLVNKDFKIHIIQGNKEEVVDNFDQAMISELGAIITLGDKFKYLGEVFKTEYEDIREKLITHKDSVVIPIQMMDSFGIKRDYDVEIHGWVGTYKSTRGRKVNVTDFPDNFISLYAHKKMGEFNILPAIGQNKLNELYVVGQLHVDIFEQTELPDMALSNRQGYKSDDIRYQKVLEYVREFLLVDILKMHNVLVQRRKKDKDEKKLEKQRGAEADLRQAVDQFKKKTSSEVATKISQSIGLTESNQKVIERVVSEEINKNSPDIGLKTKVDSQKKKILISHTRADKGLADVVYQMLLHNNVPAAEILYTSCDDEVSRIPAGGNIYEYLRDFFVDSYSTQKMHVIFVTSDNTKTSWGALVEIGAAWITQVEHQIFNVNTFRPEHPLDDEKAWHTTKRDEQGNLSVSTLNEDVFAQHIEHVCDEMGYVKKNRTANKQYLRTLLSVI